jgi:hypothetical protein
LTLVTLIAASQWLDASSEDVGKLGKDALTHADRVCVPTPNGVVAEGWHEALDDGEHQPLPRTARLFDQGVTFIQYGIRPDA